MSPERSTIINGIKIEEFYWHGDLIVYVDNCLQEDKDYDTVVKEVLEGKIS
jgi:hypothetical protein